MNNVNSNSIDSMIILQGDNGDDDHLNDDDAGGGANLINDDALTAEAGSSTAGAHNLPQDFPLVVRDNENNNHVNNIGIQVENVVDIEEDGIGDGGYNNNNDDDGDEIIVAEPPAAAARPPVAEAEAAAAAARGGGRPLLAIEDEEEWYRRNGLPPNDGENAYYEWYGGSNLSARNQHEAQQRVSDEQSYQQQVLHKFFQQDDDDDDDDEEEDYETNSGVTIQKKKKQRQQSLVHNQKQQRQNQLNSWQNTTIILQVENGQIEIECNLKSLASFSDTVYAMANSYPHYNNTTKNSNNTEEEEKSSSSPSQHHPKMELSLHNFPKIAVESFLKILFTNLQSLSSHTKASNIAQDDDNNIQQQQLEEAKHSESNNDNSGNGDNNNIDYDTLFEENHPEYIIEYCQLAHYLQCNDILERGIVPILIRNVDSSNCLSLCQLADQFHIPSLLETSLNHMILSLGSLESSELWQDLTPELRERIMCIRGILQSSNRSKLYFSSFTEYLAMFAEQVDYYQERLIEAKIQQERHLTSKRHTTKGWEYAQTKIDQQQERVNTLKLVLKEQKRLFGKKDQH